MFGNVRIFLLAFVLVLAACGGDDDVDPTATIAQEPPTATTAVEPTATSEPEPTATSEPTATTEPTSEPTVEPTATSTEEPTTGPEADLPDTPAGTETAWVLGVLNGTDTMSEDDFNTRFNESFKAEISYNQLIAGIDQIRDLYAPFTVTGFYQEPTDTDLALTLIGTGDQEFVLALGVEEVEPNLIRYFQVVFASALDSEPAVLTSWADLDAGLAELGSQVSVQVSEVTPEGLMPIHTNSSDERLAIGSAFKLYVLGELARQIEAGLVSWDDELAIRDEWKSLPSGEMQDEPAGAVFTLQEYADMMISISDNTAADHLLHHLGRENVEAFQAEMGHGDPSVNIPMLTTRELFILKLTFDDAQREAFAAADVEEQRRILAEEALQLPPWPDAGDDWIGPLHIDTIEWFASTNELSQALAFLKEMAERPGLEPISELLSINPGIQFDPAVWSWTGFKGGSEPGVMNLSWILERADGRVFTLSMTVNNSETLIDEMAMIRLAGGAANLLAATP